MEDIMGLVGRSNDGALDAAYTERAEAPRLLLISTATKVLASPLAVRFGVAICMVLSVILFAKIDADATALSTLNIVCITVALLLVPLSLYSLHRVTRDDGQLKTLGVGSTKISASAATRLKRWHVLLLLFMLTFVQTGVNKFVNVGLLGDSTLEDRVGALLAGLVAALVFPLALWWLSLKEASVLVSDRVIECRKLIDKTSATSAEWDALVVPELLKLINVTLPALSGGWGDGLLVLWEVCWMIALAIFARFLDTGVTKYVGMSVIWACMPLGLAADVASASSDCDTIKDEQNKKRADSKCDIHVGAKLMACETLLDRLNDGGGLGFVAGGKVIDKKTLRQIFAEVIAFLVVAVPVILSLQPTVAVAGANACDLSLEQTAVIRSFSLNASCTYNQSIETVRCLKSDDASTASFAPAVAMHVEVSGGAAEPPIPPNLVGFSLESYSVRKALFAPYARLLRHLHEATTDSTGGGGGGHAGPVIRIGGDSADNSCWWPRPEGSRPDEAQCKQGNITAVDLQVYKAFALAAGPGANLSYVIDTNLKQGDAAVGAAHVAGIGAAGLWPHVSGIEIGNEVDHWNPVQLSLKAYEARFANFSTLYKAARMPPKVTQGAVFCCVNPSFILGLGPYARQFEAELRTISYHDYPVSHCSNPHATAADVLSRAASKGQGEKMGVFAKAVAPLPLWAGEANSASCGGAPNVSETFASSLWSLDFLAELSKAGVAGVNFHGGPHPSPAATSDLYSPVAFDDHGNMQVRPLFLGLWAFTEFAANRSRWLPATTVKLSGLPGGLFAKHDSYAHAVLSHDSTDAENTTSRSSACATLRVLVIVKDEALSGPMMVTVDVSAALPGFNSSSAAAGVLERLLAPSLSTSNASLITWAGRSLSNTDGGVLGERVSEPVRRDAGGAFAFSVPPLSAAVLTVRGGCD